MLNKFFICLAISFTLFGCNQKYITIYEEVVVVNKAKLRDDSLLHDSILNFKFSRLVKPNSYGLGSVYKLKDEFKDKKLWIIFKAKGRTNQVYTNSFFNITVLQEDSNKVLIWKNMPLKYSYLDVNKWCWFSDSIEVGQQRDNKTFNFIEVSACLGNTNIEKFDLDTLIVKIKTKL
ncbi:MAG: hypothetical protein Q7W45_06570 [Bacteroidota bacterium]|nr:hypothetical protein [Bacteroidota bacterium]MDP3145112.1 hypothetical protein [Bacteroidota bacterium]